MTKISLYPLDTNIQDDDILLGTDKETPDHVTKNFSVGDLKTNFLDTFIVTDNTSSALTLSYLQNTYPDTNYPIGTQVMCPNYLIVGSPIKSVIYIKNAPDSWYVQYIDTVL